VCVSGIGVLSLFFNVDTSPKPQDNPFFAFLKDNKAPLDLNQLIPADFSLHNYVMGYVGTSTVPNCERGQCWYFVNKAYTLSPDQYNLLKVANVASNNRKVHNKLGAYK
jgi:carbonic anhydrase